MRLRPSTRDADLLSAAATDSRGFALFYERYEPSIVGYFMRQTRDPELAADLAAEAFAAVLVATPGYRPVSESAAGWLFTIAANTLRMSVRRGRVEETARRQLGGQRVVELQDEHLERIRRDLLDESWAADLLARSPPDQREAVRARGGTPRQAQGPGLLG